MISILLVNESTSMVLKCVQITLSPGFESGTSSVSIRLEVKQYRIILVLRHILKLLDLFEIRCFDGRVKVHIWKVILPSGHNTYVYLSACSWKDVNAKWTLLGHSRHSVSWSHTRGPTLPFKPKRLSRRHISEVALQYCWNSAVLQGRLPIAITLHVLIR